ncbi:SagB family peptide dehydrogenase [Gloeothece verrucosa]|uniref:SagB-type dehydrogenase domain protein n=1 Tax=Gloeothece verrucosa (strain PCC 7822) TaxID=497965 RepID=E0ULZ6_GLOV7|nr:SagB family peptide dehydrogenase [Gloeothece verrucosa]ADN17976.1 SagB-type dehydrogenase domain protein [Gloeothece verrucosa PCC 7822]
MSYSLFLSFRKDVSLKQKLEAEYVLFAVDISLKLPPLSSGEIAALEILLAEGATRDRLSEVILAKDGFSELTTFFYYLEKFIHLGLICHTISINGLPLATIIPCSPACQLRFNELEPNKEYILSRFAYLHKENEQMILESPLSSAQILLADWRGIALIAEMTKPRNVQELSSIIPGLLAENVQVLLVFLLTAEMIYEVKNGAILGQENSEVLDQWEFHDLLFHFKSRRGRHLNPVGKTYHFCNKFESLPVIKQITLNERIDLYKPDLEIIKENDYSFSLVLEERESIRHYGEKPLSAEQVGEFLYRCARVKSIFAKDNRECSNRPYPSGGSCYELELYLVITSCKGIEPGFYYYYPKEHQLGRMSKINSHLEKLVEDAKLAVPLQTSPQVLIIITARFARVSWLYESMAYSLILKNVGVLYQTMYLVATAMNLAPCALGTGNTELFAIAADIYSYVESSVGEFVLGSKPSY